MPEVHPRLITYCSSIHPAESWDETFAALKEHVPRVKKAVFPDGPFPIGLRLSAQAAGELAADGGAAFAQWLRAENCFVPTVNGFPYGTFHGESVKRNAYLPDWHSRERADYTKLLAGLLAGWLPRGMTGSISTVPVGFRANACAAEHRARLFEVLTHLEFLKEERGVDIVLALEPEPACFLETAAELVEFLDRMAFPKPLNERIGICLDCCHMALQFEEPEEVLSLLAKGGVRIGKVQVSSALSVRHDRRDALRRFVEPTYLHQVVVRGKEGSLSRYDDLPDALDTHRGEEGDEWRSHFHVPVFMEGIGELGSTRTFAERLLPLLDPRVLLEVETYTFDLLPPQLRAEGVTESIIREVRWLKERVDAADRRP